MQNILFGAIVMVLIALYVIYSIKDGEIGIGAYISARKEENPSWFWTIVAMYGIIIVTWIVLAIMT